MLVIKKEQIKAMDKFLIKDFVDQMMSLIKLNLPEKQNIDTIDLRKEVENIISEAIEYGFELEEDIEEYIEMYYVNDLEAKNKSNDNILNILKNSNMKVKNKLSNINLLLNNR